MKNKRRRYRKVPYQCEVLEQRQLLSADIYESDYNRNTAKEIKTNGSKQNRSIHKVKDVDWVKFQLHSPSRVTIRTRGEAGDTRLRLYKNTKLLAYNDNGDVGQFSKIVRKSLSAGEYYIKVSEGRNDGIVNKYALTVYAPDNRVVSKKSNYNIDLRFGSMSQYHRNAIRRAANRWSNIIRSDVPNTTYNGRFVDDILIRVSIKGIDGSNGTIGTAEIKSRRSSKLPIYGVIELDAKDVAIMDADTLHEVIMHEMAHVIGFGDTIWHRLVNSNGFTGRNAVREYNKTSSKHHNFIPTEGSHWSERVFDNELMTPRSDGVMPLSRMTIGAMADLGYQVDYRFADV